MSLAEVILLLLFALFVSTVVVGTETTGRDPELTITSLRAQIDTLSRQVAALEQETKRLRMSLREKEMLIEQLAKMTNAGGTDAGALLRAVTILKRGYPACAEQNILVEALVVNGSIELLVLQDVPPLNTFLSAQKIAFNKGMLLTEKRTIDQVLASILRYENQSVPRCRFDYRFRYLTAEDYRIGRERLEQYFYPERRIQIPR